MSANYSTPFTIASAINAQVNASTSYCSDANFYGRPEFWEVAAGNTVCEYII